MNAVEVRDIYGNTPLALAVIYYVKNKEEMKKQCVRFLLSCGADPNVKNSHTGLTPLHWAARWGNK